MRIISFKKRKNNGDVKNKRMDSFGRKIRFFKQTFDKPNEIPSFPFRILK
jgi:hypothetical protein